MSVEEHLGTFDGLRVVEFGSDDGPEPGEQVAWKIRVDSYPRPGNNAFAAVFGRFLDSIDTTAVTHLVIGHWGNHYQVTAEVPRNLLVTAAAWLPNLKALFFGDIIRQEAEITWIQQCDVTPLLDAFPGLERLDVRGGRGGPGMKPVSSTALKVLRIESGGLSADVVRAVGASDLPNLQTLELWLGVSEYSGDATVADLAPILSGERLPALTRLGLMNSEIQDEICAAIATAPVVARLKELALNMGVLTDDGAEALLSGQPLTHLTELDLRHHFFTDPMAARVREAFAPVKMLLMEPAPDDDMNEDWDEDDEDEWNGPRWFVAVAE